jgi:ABC-type branched-subunit amino acid transport system ATPase component/predicted MFS family arabinose efflux permease
VTSTPTVQPASEELDPAALAGQVLEEEARRQAEQDARAREERVVPDELLPGFGQDDMAFREVLNQGGRRTLVVLTLLAAMDELDRAAFAVLGPDIQRDLGISDLVLGLAGAIGGLLLFVAAIPLGQLADRHRRTTLIGICTLAWAGAAILTGFVRNGAELVAGRVLSGIGKANEAPVQNSLLADAYPLAGRNRVYAVHRASQPIGLAIGPVFAGGIAALVGGTAGWRWAFVVLALPAVLLGLLALALPEPGRGRNEQLAVLGEELTQDPDELRVPVSAAIARLKKIRTFYWFLASLGALGFAVVTAPIYTNIVLKEEFGLGSGARGVVGSLAALGGLVGVAVVGKRSESLFRRSPEKSLVLTGVLVAAYGVVKPVSLYMPGAMSYTVVEFVAQALLLGAFVPTLAITAAVTPYRLRSIGFATIGLYLSLVGGVGGALIVGGLAEAWGPRTALVISLPPAAIVGGVLLVYGSRFVRGDIAAAAAELVEERDERARAAAGAEVPVLQVRNLDFSYGSLQVLFGVDLDVHEGEVLALLGTNGAGKSTLLRAISGLGLPDRGVIRLRGRTMTFSDPGTRVRLGVVQVPGGKAVYPSLSVAENLVAGAYTYVWDVDRVRSRVAEVVELFPVLGERLDQPAGTLSGGEQQQLAIATALLLDPQVLLIDELSLGLAPVVVQELLQVIERLKERGLTIVIVEQSLNVAVAVADRAVFMEKGQVRFEGPARDLLERDDLVRAVFLGGVGQ